MSAALILEDAEIAVVGGGPAGSIAAFTLATYGHDVALIDKDSFPRDKACGDYLTPTAANFLVDLGLADILADSFGIEGAELVKGAPVANKRGKIGRRGGCCVPRRALDKALIDVAARAGVRVLRARVTGAIVRGTNVCGLHAVHEHGRGIVRAAHYIMADGATSHMRRELFGSNKAPRPSGYAVRRYLRTGAPLRGVLRIYTRAADPHPGYGWMFPVAEDVANVGIGYLTAPGLPRPRSITKLLDRLIDSLSTQSVADYGGFEPLETPLGAPLGIGVSADRCQVGNVLFVGDAARMCDPITGEGIDQAMRSAHTAASVLHGTIRRGVSSSGFGRSLARSNLRIGQDSAMLARVANELLESDASRESDDLGMFGHRIPMLSAGRDMVLADHQYPKLRTTSAGQVACQLGLLGPIEMLDEQLRDVLRTAFLLAAEILHREVCGGLGPVGAVALFAAHGVGPSKDTGKTVNAAVAVELLGAFASTLARSTDARDGEAKINNGLAVMVADYALARASCAAAEVSAEFAEEFGRGIYISSESVALLSQDRFRTNRSGVRYLDWARLRTGSRLSLAARIGATLAGVGESAVSVLSSAGEHLGIAVQICEDILALRREDPATGRPPRRALEQGDYTLPVIFALNDDADLAARLVGERDASEWDALVDSVRQGPGMTRAAAVCEQYAKRAKEMMAEIGGESSPLARLCDLPGQCLSPSGVEQAPERYVEPVLGRNGQPRVPEQLVKH